MQFSNPRTWQSRNYARLSCISSFLKSHLFAKTAERKSIPLSTLPSSSVGLISSLIFTRRSPALRNDPQCTKIFKTMSAAAKRYNRLKKVIVEAKDLDAMNVDEEETEKKEEKEEDQSEETKNNNEAAGSVYALILTELALRSTP